MPRTFLTICLVAITASCSHMRTSEFAAETPVFNPVKFFTGKTESNGVRENRRGHPVAQVFTSTSGTMKGDTLHIEQDLRFVTKGETTTSHRSWQLKQTGPHTYEATANDIIGTATGEAYGNTFHWTFPLSLSPGNPFAKQ